MREQEPLCTAIHKNPTHYFNGLENKVMLSFKNALIHEGNRIVGEIDLTLLIPAMKAIYHFEEKWHHKQGAYEKMLQQDKQHSEFIEKYLKHQQYEKVNGFYLHDKKIIEQVS